MAIFPLTDAFISIAGNDLSDHCKSVTINEGVETGDKTAMGDTTRAMKAGLLTWTVSATFHADFAAGELDAIVAGLTDSEAALIIRPTSAVVGPTNPQWTGTGVITDYTPFSGSVGDVPTETTINFVAGSALPRTTA